MKEEDESRDYEPTLPSGTGIKANDESENKESTLKNCTLWEILISRVETQQEPNKRLLGLFEELEFILRAFHDFIQNSCGIVLEADPQWVTFEFGGLFHRAAAKFDMGKYPKRISRLPWMRSFPYLQNEIPLDMFSSRGRVQIHFHGQLNPGPIQMLAIKGIRTQMPNKKELVPFWSIWNWNGTCSRNEET